MAQRMVFLEVDPEDAPFIRERFPEAAIITDALKGDDLIRACAEADVVSCFIYSTFPAAILEKLPALRLLCTRSVGFNHIDVDACRERGITVCNVPDYGSHVIAEHVFALLLSTLRHIGEGEKRTEGGTFDYRGLRGMAMRGKTIGIVGTGKIGARVAQIAYGFGMRILAFDPCRTLELIKQYGVEYVDLPLLLSRSDIITLHVPETEETHHMIDAKVLAAMKDGVVLVNTARGGLIDSAALLEALNRGKLTNALLDVLEHEQNFAENKALISHPRVVTTPHIAFYADDSMRNMYRDCFQSIDQWLAGQTPEHLVQVWNIVCDFKPGSSRILRAQ